MLNYLCRPMVKLVFNPINLQPQQTSPVVSHLKFYRPDSSGSSPGYAAVDSTLREGLNKDDLRIALSRDDVLLNERMRHFNSNVVLKKMENLQVSVEQGQIRPKIGGRKKKSYKGEGVVEILYMKLKYVETAILYGDLDSNIYVKIPEGLTLPEAKSKINHLFAHSTQGDNIRGLRFFTNVRMDGVTTSVARYIFRVSTIALYVQEHSSFQQLRNEIKALFVEADLCASAIRYSLNGGAKCNLSSDRDMHMMFVSQRVAKENFIDIEIAELQNNVITTDQVERDMGMEICDPISNVNPALLGHDKHDNIISMIDVWKKY
ncbi:hypothetical protein LguiB_016747 [Lonicera macranthoides]